MKDLTLLERLQLVKAGYKAKQIEEMIIKDATNSSDVEVSAENTSKGDAEPEQAEKPVTEENTKSDEVETPDYKSMFEDLQKSMEAMKASNEELEKKLSAAQSANLNQDVSGNTSKVSAQENVQNIFREVAF